MNNRMGPGQLQPNTFEVALLEQIAAQYPGIGEGLSRIVPTLRVLSRKFTGVGCFTDFQGEDTCFKLGDQSFAFDGLIIMPGVPNGLGAILFCEYGKPKMLEIHTYGDEHWEGDFEGFSINRTINPHQ